MNRSMGSKIIFLGFAGKFAISLVNLACSILRFDMGNLYSILNIVSILLTLAIAGGFAIRGMADGDFFEIIIAGCVVLPIILNLILGVGRGAIGVDTGVLAGGMSSIVFDLLNHLYLLLWALKSMSKNMLATLMLGCVFLVEFFSGLVFQFLVFDLRFSLTIYLLFMLAVSAIPSFVAFIEMRE